MGNFVAPGRSQVFQCLAHTDPLPHTDSGNGRIRVDPAGSHRNTRHRHRDPFQLFGNTHHGSRDDDARHSLGQELVNGLPESLR
ncbi:hypothetical protein SDC9_210880 [bioreactor metagenome]|uniref:Uncharacterized protein n=1 Tax=bioreactor metagenome TaxID=1076179 RepID=A0A645JI69_9ZZZZ